MKTISISDLKTKSARGWKALPDQQARAMQAVNAIQNESVRKGTGALSMDQIDDEIKAVRKKG